MEDFQDYRTTFSSLSQFATGLNNSTRGDATVTAETERNYGEPTFHSATLTSLLSHLVVATRLCASRRPMRFVTTLEA